MLQAESPSGIRSGGVTGHAERSAGGGASQPPGKPTVRAGAAGPAKRRWAGITITQVSEPPAAADADAFEQLIASIALPAWLPLVLTTLYAGCGGPGSDAAARWARRVEACLRDLGPARSEAGPPFEAVHDWQARTVVPVMRQACSAACEPAAREAATELGRLHARAAAGERFDEARWRAAIEPALRELYTHAYGYADAYATARASASAYAQANDFSEAGAIEFADSYAKLSADANRQSFAESNAVANAAVLAAAYASGDGRAYAESYPFALVQACAHAWADQSDQPDGQPADRPDSRAERRRAAYARLADGLIDSLADS